MRPCGQADYLPNTLFKLGDGRVTATKDLKIIVPSARTIPITALNGKMEISWADINSLDPAVFMDDRPGTQQVGSPRIICQPRHALRHTPSFLELSATLSRGERTGLYNHLNMCISSSSHTHDAHIFSRVHVSSTWPWLRSIDYIASIIDAEVAKGVPKVGTCMWQNKYKSAETSGSVCTKGLFNSPERLPNSRKWLSYPIVG